LFRRLFLEGLQALHAAGDLQFFNDLIGLKDAAAFNAHLAPLRRTEWVVYAKRPFAGPSQVLAYLARYTHRVAIGNSRLVEATDSHVTFRWKDYRLNGVSKHKIMRLAVGEFIRRFLLHVLPNGFHRIRHYGVFANGHRADNIALCRKLLDAIPAWVDRKDSCASETPPCPCCGGRMKIIESFERMLSRNYSARGFDSS
jgi:hypothetical protein